MPEEANRVCYWFDGVHTQLGTAPLAPPQFNKNPPPVRMCLCGTIALQAVNVNNVRRRKGNDGTSVLAMKILQNIIFPLPNMGERTNESCELKSILAELDRS